MHAQRPPRPAYLVAFVLLGVSLSFVGPAMTHLRHQVGASLGQGGWIVAGQSIGYIATSMAVAHRFDRGHGHRTMLQAMALVVAAVLLIDQADALWVVVAAFAIVGAAAATTDVGGNTLLVWSEPPERAGTSLNLLHLCFGIGAIATPLLVSRSIDETDGLVPVAVAIAIGATALGVLLARSRQPEPRHVHEHHPTVEPRVRARILVSVQVFFFVFAGAEATMAVWVTTWAEDLDLGRIGSPAVLTAVFWVGFTAGRLAAVMATRRHAPLPVLVLACGASTAAAALLLGAGAAPAVAWVGTALVGFALGPQFATMFAVADGMIGLDGRTTSRIVAAAGLGSLAVPAATGWLLGRFGTDLLPTIVLIGAAGSTAAALAVRAVGRGRRTATLGDRVPA